MRSSRPKVLHAIGGAPLIAHVLAAVRAVTDHIEGTQADAIGRAADLVAGSLAAGVRLQPQASDLLGPQGGSGIGSPTSGALAAAALLPSPATPVTVSRSPAGSPALLSAAGGTEGLLLFPAGVSLTGDQSFVPSSESAVVPSLPSADVLPVSAPLADWAGRSAFGFGHARPVVAHGNALPLAALE